MRYYFTEQNVILYLFTKTVKLSAKTHEFCCILFLVVEALTFPPTSGKSFIMGADEALENELGLGELAGLTVANEADSLTYDVSIL